MNAYAAIAAGGAIGACARYALSGVVYQKAGAGFPYGTFVVNILGCFLIGLIMEITEERFSATPAIRLFLTVGLLGGFTTFSTYSYETMALIKEGMMGQAFLNAAGQVLVGLFAAYLGIVAGRVA